MVLYRTLGQRDAQPLERLDAKGSIAIRHTWRASTHIDEPSPREQVVTNESNIHPGVAWQIKKEAIRCYTFKILGHSDAYGTFPCLDVTENKSILKECEVTQLA